MNVIEACAYPPQRFFSEIKPKKMNVLGVGCSLFLTLNIFFYRRFLETTNTIFFAEKRENVITACGDWVKTKNKKIS